MKTKGFTLDTNIVTALLNQNEKVRQRIEEAIESGFDVTTNAITYYEIKRGLKKIGKSKKLEEFGTLCQDCEILFVDEKGILDRASDLWANLTRQGRPIEDADILIASIAIVKDYVLVSDDADFESIPNLRVENWLK
jgi:tRNA(fMet)-specific endonuclease VapC